MARRLFIPQIVLDSIRQHVDDAVDRAVDGFGSAQEEEDTLTGQLGMCLKTGWHTVHVIGEQSDQAGGNWKWLIDYSKFRGRGKRATESSIGADGIIELRLTSALRTDTKSVLFQSKNQWKSDPNLLRQAALMSTWREAAVVIDFTPKGFDCYSIDSVLASKGRKASVKGGVDLKSMLGDFFLECSVGNTDLHYNATARKLLWRANHEVVAAQFSIPSRIRIRVRSPRPIEDSKYEKLIPFNEIHAHRMDVEPTEILALLLTDEQSSVRDQKKNLSMIYHPDRYVSSDFLIRDVMARRMQEVNAAADKCQK